MTNQPADATKNLRGVSEAIYHRVRRMVVAGEITWEQAEKDGLVGPASKRGRKRLPIPTLKENDNQQRKEHN